MFNKGTDTKAPLHDLIARRWSGRAFDPKRLVSREHIIALLEAARWSPSCFGAEPWNYIVCDKSHNTDAWHKAFACLAEGNQTWAAHAPVLILALSNTQFGHNEQPNRWAQYDTGAATMSLCLQATAIDLMVHQMGGFDADQSCTAFAVPEHSVPMSMIAVGYQLPEDEIVGEIREREYAERRRSPLQDSFFDGTWGKPIS